jgi:glutamate dehydrogenase (NADP+)
MSQNAARQRWSFDDSEAKLRAIMADVHDSAFAAAEKFGHPGDYVVGANCAGFERVAHAMLAQGVI